MVITVHGEQAWQSVLSESGAADGDFLPLRGYNDEIAYTFAGACSKILAAPAEACLRNLGRSTSESLHSTIGPLSVRSLFILNSLLAKTKKPPAFYTGGF